MDIHRYPLGGCPHSNSQAAIQKLESMTSSPYSEGGQYLNGISRTREPHISLHKEERRNKISASIHTLGLLKKRFCLKQRHRTIAPIFPCFSNSERAAALVVPSVPASRWRPLLPATAAGGSRPSRSRFVCSPSARTNKWGMEKTMHVLRITQGRTQTTSACDLDAQQPHWSVYRIRGPCAFSCRIG